MAGQTLVTALVLSPIRRRNAEGDLEILMPDGKTTGEFKPREAQYLKACGAIELPGSDTPESQGKDASSDDPMASLVEAIGELDPENPDHFTTTGKPEIAALKKVSGAKKLSGSERDAAWEAWQKRNPPAGSGAGTESTGASDSGDAGTGAGSTDGQDKE